MFSTLHAAIIHTRQAIVLKPLTGLVASAERTFSTLLHTGLLTLLLACSGGEPRKAATGDASDATKRLRVALLTPGPISDQSWNGGAYTGLMRIRDSLGAQVSHIQTRTPAEFEEQFRHYGAQRYDLVFGHGFEFQDAAKRVGPDYPNTIYITTSSTTSGANVAGLSFAFADASYLAGIVAGSLTRSNTLGVIGGTALPPVRESFDAFTAGARSVNAKVVVLTSYIGNWDDVSAGKEQALAQIGRGADLIFQNADAAGLGVFQAARETKKALVVGSNSNQNGVAPEVTIGSVVIDLPHAFLTVAREVQQKTFKARVIRLGTQSEVVTLVMNPVTRALVPAPVLAIVDSVRGELRAGRFSPLPGKAAP
ncbi:MAG: BMP family protein [Gemmatimonadaceae bacterium]|nr:BMP family protein [Gemmatimonadaceae bacterium]